MTMTNPITIDTTQREHEQRRAFRDALGRMDVTLSTSSFERAFARTREVADENGEVPGDRLRAIVDDVISGMEVFQGVADSYR